MITKAFALYDTKAGMFHAPFFMPHMGQAIRAVIDLGTDLNTTVGRHPSDFALYDLGTFDDSTGVMSPTPPSNLGLVSGFLPAQPRLGFSEPLPDGYDQAAAIARPNGQAHT